MRRLRYRRSIRFVCAGCGTDHQNIPYFRGPEMDGKNLYCNDSHPDKPMQDKQKVLQALFQFAREAGYMVWLQSKSEAFLKWEARVGNWDQAIEGGKSYMYGSDKPTKEYIRKYSSTLSAIWMKLAYQLAMLDTTIEIHLRSQRLAYHVYKVGEYVEFRLPYHGQGGEKSYITKDGKRKVQTDQD